MSWYYSINGVTIPVGGPTRDTAQPITALSVTAPFGGTEEWFWFSAIYDAEMIFDISLSFDMATLSYPGFPFPQFTFYSGLTEVGSSTSSLTVSVTAGTLYYIKVTKAPTDFTTAMILRVSDYARPTPWIQGADEEWVLSDPYGGTGVWHPRDLVPLVETLDGFGGTATNQPVGGAGLFDGFNGSYDIGKTFGGPEPGGDPLAMACTWKWAREGNWGGQNWGLYPQGHGSPQSADTWNGTDPYRAGDPPGSGTCLTHSGYTESSGGFGAVGCDWHASANFGFLSGGNEHASFQSYAIGERLWLRQVIPYFGPWAGQVLPTDSPSPGATLEWESQLSTLLGVDASPDQDVDRGEYVTILASGGDLVVQWFIKQTGPTAAEENPTDGWGPYLNTAGTIGFEDPSLYELGWHGGDGIDSFGSSQDLELPDFTNSAGDNHAWQALPDLMVTNALAAEDEWQHLWTTVPSDELARYSWFGGGLRAIAMYPGMLDDTLPNFDYGAWNISTDTFAAQYRTGQCVAYRLHLRPAPHRWQPVPVSPPVDDVLPTITGLIDELRDRFAP